tara:strand:+ start:11429 stop:12085 length:657 start_codon:yes stop_codon:yes gene_type:complete
MTAANFTGAEGMPGHAQQAVNETIRRINQEEFQWPFNHADGSQLLVADGTQEYTLPTSYQAIDWDTFYLVKNASLEQTGVPLKFIEYDEWVSKYRSNDEDTIASISDLDSVPSYVFKTPDGKFGISPPPSKAFTITFDYWAAPSELVGDSDTTVIPARYDNVIIDGAMVQIHMMRDNLEAVSIAEKAFKRGLDSMRTQLINQYQHIFDSRTSFGIRRG